MFQTIHRNLLPSCNSYEGAVKVWEEAYIAPKFGGWRGLKDRRDTGKTVKRRGETIDFRFHHTDLVTWEPGRLWVRCWDSASSIVFANQFLPPRVHARSIKGEMHLVTPEGTFRNAGEAIQLYLKDGQWVVNPDTVETFKEYVLDRKAAVYVRQVIKPWMEWRQAMRRMGALPMHVYIGEVHTFLTELKPLLRQRQIDETHYRQLADVCPYDDEALMPTLYVLGGAVLKADVPFGEVPKKSPYQYSPAWSYI